MYIYIWLQSDCICVCVCVYGLVDRSRIIVEKYTLYSQKSVFKPFFFVRFVMCVCTFQTTFGTLSSCILDIRLYRALCVYTVIETFILPPKKKNICMQNGLVQRTTESYIKYGYRFGYKFFFFFVQYFAVFVVFCLTIVTVKLSPYVVVVPLIHG